MLGGLTFASLRKKASCTRRGGLRPSTTRAKASRSLRSWPACWTVSRSARKKEIPETNLIVAVGRESGPKLAREVVSVAAKFRSKGVVGVDIGGPEKGNPPERFADAFKLALRFNLHRTVHAGEGAGSVSQNLKNIEAAVLELGAERIGHAVDLASSEALVKLVVRKHVTIEMNPISNIILKKIRSLRDLGIDSLLEKGVGVCVNSDDPALWPRGTISEVLSSVCRSTDFGWSGLDKLIMNSFAGAFVGQMRRDELAKEYISARGRT